MIRAGDAVLQFGKARDGRQTSERIVDAVLALLWLGRHDGWRAWKSFDWDAMERLHRKAMISNPAGRARSVALTEQGRREAERLVRQLFTRRT